MATPGGTVNLVAKPLLSQARRQCDAGEYEGAAQSLMGYLRQRPDDSEALALLGKTAMMVGAHGQAERFLRQALARGATGFEVRRDLAAVLSLQERPGDVLALIEALAKEHADPALRVIQAGTLNKLGRNAEALAMHAQLAEENPASPPAAIAYGHDLRAAGRVDEAIAAYRRASDVRPSCGDAWWGLASIKRPVLCDADIAVMRRALAETDDAGDTAPLNFALARALHDRGEYETAFAHYTEGNRLRAEKLQYNAAELTEEVRETERVATGAFIDALPADLGGPERPVFVISMPRSGSTLLEQMLGSHPQIEPVGELAYIPAILRTMMEMATRRAKVTVTQAIAALPDAQALAMGQDYLRRVAHHRKTNRPLFIDKLPHNWSNVLFIRRILPQARFIDIRRPAMDCCFSNFTQSFTDIHASSFALRDVGQCYVDNVRLMDHFDRVAPGLIHHTAYTDLVEQPREELGRILAYLGLPWDDTVLDFHQLDRVVRTPSSEQVRRPLNRDGIGVWQPYSQWLDPLREVLGDLAEG